MSAIISLHVIGAFLSLVLLIIRGGMQFSGKDWRAVKPLKILPHLSDTLLLTTAIIFFVMGGFDYWKLSKALCFVVYVVFAAKFFSRKAEKPNSTFFLLSAMALVTAIYLGYSH